MSRKAIITGVTGQDGSYLAELLLDKGYQVFGMVRRTSTPSTSRIDHLLRREQRFHYVEGDITDASGMFALIQQFQPDEFYNLAAQSHVGTSFNQPMSTFDVDAVGVLNCLEAIRQVKPNTKFYQASTSELFGNAPAPQSEVTQMIPRSPYAVAKLAAHQMVRLYREAYGIFACAGILFNHEGPRRGHEFVTRKVTAYVAKLAAGIIRGDVRYDPREYEWRVKSPDIGLLQLGNLDAKRDWGSAHDYVQAMHLMLQAERPDDFVIATGETHTVREFVQAAFGHIGLARHWQDFVEVDSGLRRPAEVNCLCGDASKAKRILGWEPQCKFDGLVATMMEADLGRLNITAEEVREAVSRGTLGDS